MPRCGSPDSSSSIGSLEIRSPEHLLVIELSGFRLVAATNGLRSGSSFLSAYSSIGSMQRR